jgi:hypothetical protein
MNFPRKCIVALLLGSALTGFARTVTIQAGPNEKLQTLSAAIQASRELRQNGATNVRILLRGGVYALEKPLILTGADSGLEVRAFRHEQPILTGQARITGWTVSPRDPRIWQTTIPDVRGGNWNFHELFVNNHGKPRTRVPAQGYFHAVGGKIPDFPAELRFQAGDIKPEWSKPGDVELVLYSAWAQSRNQIREVFPGSNIVSLAGNPFPNDSEPNARFYIENAPVDLRPGQWHLDLRSGILTYWPDAGEDMLQANITAPHLYDLVHLEGTAELPVHNIEFHGLTFADTDWPLDGGSDIDPQAAVERPSAVQLHFARHCTFERCSFERLGTYAIEIGRGCQDDKIIGNEMRDLGAGGVRVGESDLYGGDHFPCGHHLVTDNHIHDIGQVNAPGVGIFVLLSASNIVAHNEIDHTFYTAISVGWTWGYGPTPCRGNIIEFNHLHDIGQAKLSDMGGVYTLGLQPGAIVRNNLIHDVRKFIYGGWGLYTDEGSTGIVLESNVVYRCQSAGFHQHYGRDNIFRNNIFAFNEEVQLARTRVQTGTSFIFTNNIVYFDHGSLFGGNWGDDVIMDNNIYFDTRAANGQPELDTALQKWRAHGHDLHSLVIDPLFDDPLHDHFQLKRISPALRYGFRRIDLASVGPRPEYRRRP